MPYTDPARGRKYDNACEPGKRAQGLTKKDRHTSNRPFHETAEDLRGLSNQVGAEVQNADRSSLKLELS